MTEQHSTRIHIHNGLAQAPGGIAFVINDVAAFVVHVAGAFKPGTAAPDDSIYQLPLSVHDVAVLFEWSRVGDAVVARLTADKPVDVTLNLRASWPGFTSTYTPTSNGVVGEALLTDQSPIAWQLVADPAPLHADSGHLVLPVRPQAPARFAAGVGALPDVEQVDTVLEKAARSYAARKPAASGPLGDFVGAIADNLNNSRVYSSDNRMRAHVVSRTWLRNDNPNTAPYFCWDSFFNGLLACLDDSDGAKDTIRAILSCQTEEGFIPNFGHWDYEGSSYSKDRSQPPVAALCVWRMHQHGPDVDFLKEVYPRLVVWHDWWPQARDGNQDGLLEWGSNGGGLRMANWETGWDDTPHFDGATMVGYAMNASAVDLNALWSMDAEHLARIADVLGETADAARFRAEHQAMNQRMNAHLWNDDLGIYCSRLWDENNGTDGVFLTRLTPMNFYPMICGTPDADRAERVLDVLTNPGKFWGEWILPTLAYDDPDWPEQHYWRGKVWGPANYLAWQGVQRYAPPEVQLVFAQKSVELFMRNWVPQRLCGENYLSTTGEQSSDPHYTWGALLCRIGLEAMIDTAPDGTIVPGPALANDCALYNIPLHGQRYHVRSNNGQPLLEKSVP